MRTVQPSELLSLLNIKNREEGLRVLSEVLDFLIYLAPGDSLETNNSKFQKLDKNLIYLETELDCRQSLETLQEKQVIRFPF